MLYIQLLGPAELTTYPLTGKRFIVRNVYTAQFQTRP